MCAHPFSAKAWKISSDLVGKVPNGPLNIWCDLFTRLYSKCTRRCSSIFQADSERRIIKESCFVLRRPFSPFAFHKRFWHSVKFRFFGRAHSSLSISGSQQIHKLVTSMNKHAMVSSFLWWLIRFARKKKTQKVLLRHERFNLKFMPFA